MNFRVKEREEFIKVIKERLDKKDYENTVDMMNEDGYMDFWDIDDTVYLWIDHSRITFAFLVGALAHIYMSLFFDDKDEDRKLSVEDLCMAAEKAAVSGYKKVVELFGEVC